MKKFLKKATTMVFGVRDGWVKSDGSFGPEEENLHGIDYLLIMSLYKNKSKGEIYKINSPQAIKAAGSFFSSVSRMIEHVQLHQEKESLKKIFDTVVINSEGTNVKFLKLIEMITHNVSNLMEGNHSIHQEIANPVKIKLDLVKKQIHAVNKATAIPFEIRRLREAI